MAHKILEEIIGKILQGTAKRLADTGNAGRKIGISTAFVSRVERGQKKMKVETLYATAKVLNVSVDALLSTEAPRHSWQTSTSFWRASPMSIWRNRENDPGLH